MFATRISSVNPIVVPTVNFDESLILSFADIRVSVVELFTAPFNVVVTVAGWSQAPDEGTNTES